MKKIFKYKLEIKGDTQLLNVPKGARLLTVQNQDSVNQAWFEVDPDAEIVSHQFTIVGTGHEIPVNAGEYVTTIQMGGGFLVLHVYYGGEV